MTMMMTMTMTIDVDLIHAEHLPHLVQADSLPIGVPSLLHDDDDEYHKDNDDDDDMYELTG